MLLSSQMRHTLFRVPPLELLFYYYFPIWWFKFFKLMLNRYTIKNSKKKKKCWAYTLFKMQRRHCYQYLQINLKEQGRCQLWCYVSKLRVWASRSKIAAIFVQPFLKYTSHFWFQQSLLCMALYIKVVWAKRPHLRIEKEYPNKVMLWNHSNVPHQKLY